MLKIKQFAFNIFGVNTYILFDDSTNEAIVIDPGMTTDSERRFFDEFIANNKLKLTQIVNTHLHLDHCFGNNYVKTRYGATIAANNADAPLGAMVGMQARQFGVEAPEGADKVTIDIALKEGDIVKLGNHELHVIEVPGHSPGGIALYCPEYSFAFVGDSIFYHSIGRTDLPGGDHSTLIDNLNRKILTLPSNTHLLTGHDRPTTVADEKTSNPYLR